MSGKRIEVFAPDGTLLVVEDTRDLAAAKEQQNEATNQFRDVRLDSGIYAFGRKWDSDDRSRQNLTGITSAINAGFAIPAGFSWRDFHNDEMLVSEAILVGLGIMLLSYVSQVYAHSWVIKQQIATAASLAELDAVDIYAGWPDGNMDGSMP